MIKSDLYKRFVDAISRKNIRSVLNNFSDIAISYAKIGYNTFFTLFLFPVFWFIFNIYQLSFIGSQDA